MNQLPKDGTFPLGLFVRNVFDGFGPSRYRPIHEPVVGRVYRSQKPSHLRKQVSKHAPRSPGVYGMINDRGRLIYVGKAKDLRNRLLSYFRVNSRHPKAARIIRHTRGLLWEQWGDEFAALLRELELIQLLRPRFNVLGIPGLQRHHYICLGKSPAPCVYVTNKPSGKELGVYGPFVVRWKSELAARKLNDWFNLRDCPQTVGLSFADEPTLFETDPVAKCIRFELKTCMGPCVAACSRQQYWEAVRQVKAFLDGRDRSLLARLRESMEAAAAKLEYEKALSLRDRLLVLEWLDARLTLIRKARNRNYFIYPLTGHDGRERWYSIRRGQVVAVCYKPETAADYEQVRSLLAGVCDASESAGSPVLHGGAVDNVLLVLGWFRKHPEEQARLIRHAEVLELCRRQQASRTDQP